MFKNIHRVLKIVILLIGLSISFAVGAFWNKAMTDLDIQSGQKVVSVVKGKDKLVNVDDLKQKATQTVQDKQDSLKKQGEAVKSQASSAVESSTKSFKDHVLPAIQAMLPILLIGGILFLLLGDN